MYDTEREHWYRQYQEACEKITLVSVLALAQEVRQEWPDAKYVALATTDFDDSHQTVVGVLDGEWSVLSDDVSCDSTIDETETSWNLYSDRWGNDVWQACCVPTPPDTGLSADYMLDIDAVLAAVSPEQFQP